MATYAGGGGGVFKPPATGSLRTPSKPPVKVTYPVPPRASAPVVKTTAKSSSSSSSKAAASVASSNKAALAAATANQKSAEARANASATANQKAAEARGKASQLVLDKKASARLSTQAQRLIDQGNALKIALGSTGFLRTLNRDLANSNLEFAEDEALILSQYERGKTELEKQATTSEDNRARSLGEATNNAGRERNEALQQGIENGISATDMIKTQAASLRSWAFNAGQVQTNYTDEINGLQSEHSQMVNSVVTSRQAAFREREQQRSQLYRGYYDNRSQVLTETGNKMGEAALTYEMANEQVASSTSKAKAKSASATALANLRAAGVETGKGYKEAATPASIAGWQGTAKITNTNDPRMWGKQELEIKDAEGASTKLRKWEE